MLGIMLAAICMAALIAVVYVKSLYVWEYITPSIKGLGRDDPEVVLRRVISITISSLIAWCITERYTGHVWVIPETSYGNLIRTATQVTVLLAGPLYQHMCQSTKLVRFDLNFLRDVVLSPFFEELVFREFMFQILRSGGCSTVLTIMVAPAVFGCAHIHHYIGCLPMHAIAGQIFHTFVFGWIAFYFLLHRSMWDGVLAHSICNLIGLPRTVNGNPAPRHAVLIYVLGLVLFLGSTPCV